MLRNKIFFNSSGTSNIRTNNNEILHTWNPTDYWMDCCLRTLAVLGLSSRVLRCVCVVKELSFCTHFLFYFYYIFHIVSTHDVFVVVVVALLCPIFIFSDRPLTLLFFNIVYFSFPIYFFQVTASFFSCGVPVCYFLWSML